MLFTSYAQLKRTSQAIGPELPRPGSGLRAGRRRLGQYPAGDFPRDRKGRAARARALSGKGVDIPGEALSVLVIVKLPFDVPSDPIVAARSETFEQRFTGCGFGPATKDVRINVYGASGDYLASGIDGMEIYVHGNAQDQLCQIMKDGKLVVFGDVGQTFMYGAKGGSAYIMGNAAGRPLINAVGRPRVVINGTALDYLAESFMAGDPLKGGGFVILNGIGFDDEKGEVYEYDTPYPGSNIFSLASGGAIYVRDPHRKLVDEQLNGGEFAEITDADWKLILPYLTENEKLFDITVDRLLTVAGNKKSPQAVYRKIMPQKAVVPVEEDDGLEE